MTQMILRDSDGDVIEKPPRAVLNRLNKWLELKREVATKTGERDEARASLIEIMREKDIKKVPIDGENKYVELEESEDVKIKTGKKPAETNGDS